MKRRDFLKAAALGVGLLLTGKGSESSFPTDQPDREQSKFPTLTPEEIAPNSRCSKEQIDFCSVYGIPLVYVEQMSPQALDCARSDSIHQHWLRESDKYPTGAQAFVESQFKQERESRSSLKYQTPLSLIRNGCSAFPPELFQKIGLGAIVIAPSRIAFGDGAHYSSGLRGFDGLLVVDVAMQEFLPFELFRAMVHEIGHGIDFATGGEFSRSLQALTEKHGWCQYSPNDPQQPAATDWWDTCFANDYGGTMPQEDAATMVEMMFSSPIVSHLDGYPKVVQQKVKLTLQVLSQYGISQQNVVDISQIARKAHLQLPLPRIYELLEAYWHTRKP